MPHYRIYRINHLGRIAAAFDVECSDDDEALRQTTSVLGPDGHGEVWQGPRLVGRPPF